MNRNFFLILCGILCFLINILACNHPTQVTVQTGPVWITLNQSNSPLLGNKINDLAIDAEGKIWIASDSGANAYKQSSWSSYKDSLAWQVSGQAGTAYSRVVNSISTSTGSTVWFATRGGGLVRFNPTSSTSVWTKFNTGNGMPNNSVNGVTVQLSHSEVWVATNYGSSRYVPSLNLPDQGTWTRYNSSSYPFSSDNLVFVKSDPGADYSVWFGTYADGLVYFDGDRNWESFTIPGQYDQHVTSLAFDANNIIWVGRGDGASKLNSSTGVWKQFSYTENTNHVMPFLTPVNAVATDARSLHWFGTNKGLVLLSDTTWSIFTHATTPELPSDTIRSLAYDRRGNLWIGTYNGIAVYNPGGTTIK